MDNQQAVSTLKNLSEISLDGVRGFNDAAEMADDAALKTFFTQRANQCSAAVAELNTCIKTLGGTPDQGGTIAGAAHRSWQKVKAAFGESNLAVLEEVERGEDHAKAAYQKALQQDLPLEARELVQSQHAGVLRNHDSVKAMRDSYLH